MPSLTGGLQAEAGEPFVGDAVWIFCFVWESWTRWPIVSPSKSTVTQYELIRVSSVFSPWAEIPSGIKPATQ